MTIEVRKSLDLIADRATALAIQPVRAEVTILNLAVTY